jgi:flavin prenyltransferase
MTKLLSTVIGITGASGSILGFELAKSILKLQQPVDMIITSQSFPVIHQELDMPLGEKPEEKILDYFGLPHETHRHLIQCHGIKNFYAPPASGTYLTRGMVVIPCSMTTLGKMASGVTDNLVARAADVTLKERRKLIIVPRESPFNQIHLENMLRLNNAGALILPPMLSFYQEAFDTLEGQVAYTVGKVMDHLGLTEHNLYPRWGSPEVIL